jgi:hypothetical protein
VPKLDVVVQRRVGSVLFDFPDLEVEYGLHHYTVEEEVRTLHNRHLFATPVPDASSREFKLLKKVLVRFAKKLGFCSRAPLSTLVQGRSGRRRARFFQGVKEWMNEGVERKHARLSEMQKLEFYETTKIAGKEDRGIQYRSVRYNAELATHLHNVEAKVCGYHGKGGYHVAKGKTPQQRCINFFKQLSRFKDPIVVNGDHHRFDAHLHYLLVLLEHMVYKICRKYKRRLVELLKWQLVSYGISKGGVRYRIRGKRASGDINTGCGNSVINIGLIEAWAESVGLTEDDYDFTVDGDDFYIIIERAKRALLATLVPFMLKCGMVTEIVVEDDPFKSEFCQSRPVVLPGGPTFVRNPMKVLATLGRSPEGRTRSQLQQSVRASCLCEMAMAPGSPVNSVVARKVYKLLGANGKAAFNPAQAWKFEQYGMTEFEENDVEPDWLARYTFWRAWGIDDGEQHHLESMSPRMSALNKERLTNAKSELHHMEAENLGVVDPVCECGDCPTFDLEHLEVERWL